MDILHTYKDRGLKVFIWMLAFLVVASVLYGLAAFLHEANAEHGNDVARCHYYKTLIENSSTSECAEGKLSNYFGDYTWSAQHVISGESSCTPGATNANTNGTQDTGLFQINDIHCGSSFTCERYEQSPGSPFGDTVSLNNDLSTCRDSLKNPHTNKIIACALFEAGDNPNWVDGGTPNWGHWRAAHPDACDIVYPSTMPTTGTQDCVDTCIANGNTPTECNAACSDTGPNVDITPGGEPEGLDPVTGRPLVLTRVTCNVNWPNIPGFGDLNDICDGEQEVAVTDLVTLGWGAGLWFGGIAAFVVLVYTGFMYVFSGASPANRAKANQMLQNVAWGIGILLLSFVALNLINPDIVNLEFEEPALTPICPPGGETEDCVQLHRVPLGHVINVGVDLAEECGGLIGPELDQCLDDAINTFMSACHGRGDSRSACMEQCIQEGVGSLGLVATEQASQLCSEVASDYFGGPSEDDANRLRAACDASGDEFDSCEIREDSPSSGTISCSGITTEGQTPDDVECLNNFDTICNQIGTRTGQFDPGNTNWWMYICNF